MITIYFHTRNGEGPACISVAVQWNLYRGYHLDRGNVERGVSNSEVDSYAGQCD